MLGLARPACRAARHACGPCRSTSLNTLAQHGPGRATCRPRPVDLVNVPGKAEPNPCRVVRAAARWPPLHLGFRRSALPDLESLQASRDVLSRLPVFAYLSAAQKKQLSCSVCLADFKEGERGRFLPRCFHCYHVECIDEWLASHSACPVCRASIDAKAAQPPV